MKRGAAIAGLMAGALLAGASVTDLGAETEAPNRIQLLDYGTKKTRDGRGPFTLKDQAQARAVVASTKAYLGNTRMMIDYDHQLVFGARPGVGGQAPAAGWVKEFHVDEQGIWATVEWTEAASAKIKAHEYRYVSPFFQFDKNGSVIRFINASIVNHPALDLQALTASVSDFQEKTMDLTALAKLLGLAEDADVDAIVAAVTTLKAEKDELDTERGQIAAAVKIDDATVKGAIVAAVTGAVAAAATNAPDPKKFVPIEGFNELKTKVDELQGTALAAEVDAAVESGKLAPAMKEWGMNLIKSDRAAFSAFVKDAPALVSNERTNINLDAKSDTLTEQEKATCAAIGVPEEDYLKTRKAEAA